MKQKGESDEVNDGGIEEPKEDIEDEDGILNDGDKESDEDEWGGGDNRLDLDLELGLHGKNNGYSDFDDQL